MYADLIKVENGMWPLHCPQRNFKFVFQEVVKMCERNEKGGKSEREELNTIAVHCFIAA